MDEIDTICKTRRKMISYLDMEKYMKILCKDLVFNKSEDATEEILN